MKRSTWFIGIVNNAIIWASILSKTSFFFAEPLSKAFSMSFFWAFQTILCLEAGFRSSPLDLRAFIKFCLLNLRPSFSSYAKQEKSESVLQILFFGSETKSFWPCSTIGDLRSNGKISNLSAVATWKLATWLKGIWKWREKLLKA